MTAVDEPGAQTGFVVEVKDDALDVNEGLVEAVETHGRTLDFSSRADGERYASRLSASGGSVKIQAAPENEPREVDAYLLADHSPSITEPATIDGDTWTFDVGANLFGALGEAILLGSAKPHALHYFVRQDLDLEEDDVDGIWSIDVQPGSFVEFDEYEKIRKGWEPDCRVIARDRRRRSVLERYFCEIKTGNASFERSQIKAMERLAREERVLKIRMSIEELPERYSLRIDEVKPPG